MRWDAAFDDLALGQRFESHGRTLTDADIAAFAALTGDMHPQHIDAEWAARGPFGRRIAHGMLLLSYAVGLAPFAPERLLALHAVRNAVFKCPVTIGTTIRLRGEIVRLRALRPDAGLIAWRWEIVDQLDEVCVRAEVDVLWGRETRNETPPTPQAA